MKGKVLENIVLGLGLLVIGAAVFLMYVDTEGVAARSVNIIFSLGFIIYILYSFILSQNLNKEINGLNKIVHNLKEEVGRLTATVAKRDATILEKNQNITTLTQDLEQANAALSKSSEELKKAVLKISELESQLKKEDE